jgi:hypothetical protein
LRFCYPWLPEKEKGLLQREASFFLQPENNEKLITFKNLKRSVQVDVIPEMHRHPYSIGCPVGDIYKPGGSAAPGRHFQ